MNPKNKSVMSVDLLQISDYEATVRGKPCWVVQWYVDGRRKRKYVRNKSDAGAYRNELLRLHSSHSTGFQTLDPLRRADAERCAVEAASAGQSLVEYILSLHAPKSQRESAKTLWETIVEMEAVKVKSGRATTRTMSNARCVHAAFARGRESMLLSAVTHEDIEQFIFDSKPGSRETYLRRIKALFNFAMKREYLSANPVAKVVEPKYETPRPRIFTPDEMQKILSWFQLTRTRGRPHQCFASFVLGTFCGLRPEEAWQMQWSDIRLDVVDGDVPHVIVPAAISKTRIERHVDLLPAAVAWLKEARAIGSKLPVKRDQWPSTIRKIKTLLRETDPGWKWQHDITRHTAASYLMSAMKDAGKVSVICGHTIQELTNTYQRTVLKPDNDRFWSLRPTPLKDNPA